MRSEKELTIDYYNKKTTEFFDETVIADVGPLHERFLKYVPEHGRVLDFGCGSGRDTKIFKNMGYLVDAIDGSSELAKKASEYSGVEVRCMDFFELCEKDKYDGIWACASLLHVKKERLPEIIGILRDALVPGGVLYMSFKYGDFAGVRDDRYFVDLNEESVNKIFDQVDGIETVEQWYSQDVRRNKDVEWMKAIVRKIL